MAVTNGWGQAAKNNTNGYGKLATNNVGAGSIYDSSYAGDTALIGVTVSAAFSYSAASFTQAESNPTPTITGTTGGVFSGTSGLVFVSTSTGEIDLSASTIAAHVVTYTVDGVSADFNLSVTAAPFSNVYSFEFDGIDENFEIENSTDLEPLNLTVSIWFKGSTQSTSNTYLISKVANSGFKGYALYTGGSTDKLVFFIYNGSTWVLYVDGSLYSQTTSSSGITYNAGSLIIGARDSSNNLPFSGNIDEVSIWDSALSSSAITEIYNEQPSGSGKPNDLTSLTNASSSNLKAWYRMGEEGTFNSGTGNWTLTDQGSGGNNATSNNMEEADRKADTP